MHDYSYVQVNQTGEIMLKDNNNNTLYIEIDGKLTLNQGQIVYFNDSNNTTMLNFLKNNNIARIVIDLNCYDTPIDGEAKKIYEQYNTNDIYPGNNSSIDNEFSPENDPAADPDKPSTRKVYKT